MNDADKQEVKELVADALATLHEHPSHWCTGHGFEQVAARLRKPTKQESQVKPEAKALDVQKAMTDVLRELLGPNMEKLDERIAGAFEMLYARTTKSGYPATKSAGLSARRVAAKLRKPPATRLVVTYTQKEDAARHVKGGESFLKQDGTFDVGTGAWPEGPRLIFARKETTDYGKLH